MALDFPASPALNEVFTSGGVTYFWNGYAWEGGGAISPASVTSVSDTAPANPLPGQLWWESDTGMLFVNYNDGTGPAQWVQINALQANAVLKTGDTMSGALAISNATASTSSATGALTVAGGVGIAGTSYINGGVVIPLSGVALPISNAALRLGYHGVNNYGAAFRPQVDGGVACSFNNAAGTGVGYIGTSAAATAYVTSSSAELKEDLQSFDAGQIIDDTEVYDFKWKGLDERAYGVIAQQAVEVYPTAISHIENEETGDFWGVDYSKYVPVILQELKAVRARLAELEASVSPKKGR